MTYINLSNATQDSPVPSSEWVNLTEEGRLLQVKNKAKKFTNLTFTRVDESGFVYLTINEFLDAGDRESLLLKLESFLKNELDQGISIWHEPIGDKNSLRGLRGVKINL